jgi:hypothetical protein
LFWHVKKLRVCGEEILAPDPGEREEPIHLAGSAGRLLFWLIVIAVVEMLGDRPHSFSVASTVLIGLITLPISLLGGYLAGIGRWEDREQKYPEDTLPPGE